MGLLERIFALKYNYAIFSFGIVAIILNFISFDYIKNSVSKNLKNVIIDNREDRIIGYDIDNNFIFANASAVNYLNNRGKGTVAQIAERILSERDKEFNLIEQEKFSFNYSLKEGKENKEYVFYSKRLYDKNNNYCGIYIVIHDQTEELKNIAESMHKLSHDCLTGIYNKDYIESRAKEVLANSKEEYYCVYTDIKNFKLINDYYGPDVGDEVLIAFADKIDKLFNKMEEVIYGRYASDHFVIILPARIYKKINLKKEINKVQNELRYSIKFYTYFGIYKIKDHNQNISIMIDYASLGLNKAKKSYNNFIAFYNEDIKNNLYREQEIVSRFQDAIDNREFVMYLQPQVNDKKDLIGSEALVRWIKNEIIIPPKEFIPVLESTGLIYKLDLYIWEEAAKFLSEINSNNFSISVNISPYDFFSVDVYRVFTRLVNKYKINPNSLKLEITESSFIDENSEVLSTVDKLRKDGFIVEMDDFGSGYSSLNLLKNINIDVIKMDMGFLYETDNLDKSRAILSALINLSKDLGLSVVTEGVETEEQFNYLKKIGCDVFQGYYIDKPISNTEFKDKYLK